jgi:hypothetical protein
VLQDDTSFLFRTHKNPSLDTESNMMEFSPSNSRQGNSDLENDDTPVNISKSGSLTSREVDLASSSPPPLDNSCTDKSSIHFPENPSKKDDQASSARGGSPSPASGPEGGSGKTSCPSELATGCLEDDSEASQAARSLSLEAAGLNEALPELSEAGGYESELERGRSRSSEFLFNHKDAANKVATSGHGAVPMAASMVAQSTMSNTPSSCLPWDDIQSRCSEELLSPVAAATARYIADCN